MGVRDHVEAAPAPSEALMPPLETLLFGFCYHRVGSTRRWRPSGSTLSRVTGPRVAGPSVYLAFQTDRIVWIDVIADEVASQDVNLVSARCEARADAEFRRLFPHDELAAPE